MREDKLPKVSIIIPVYNMAETLERSVNTLLLQSYSNIEIIIVDDGSTDSSLTVANELAGKDNRVIVIHTENRGAGPARNKGLDISTGKYAYFPDADDSLAAEAISIMVKSIEGEPECDLLVFGYANIDRNGKCTSEKQYFPEVIAGTTLRNDYCECMGMTTPKGIQGAPWNKLFSVKLIRDNHIEFPALRRHQDEGFICRYMCFANRVKFISDILYFYNVNDIQSTWHKYPLNYIDSVIGLNNIRKETIYKWNPNDINTHVFLKREFICNVIKSLELCYSPKMSKGITKRIRFIKNGIIKSGLSSVTIPDSLGTYQKTVLRIMRVSPVLLLPIFWLKTRTEKLGIL